MNEATIEAVGGAVGAVIAVAATYPLTTVSTWQALEHRSRRSRSSSTSKENVKGVARILPTPLKEIALYSKQQGWGALFAGLRPCLVATGVSQGLYFYLYSTLRQAVVAYQTKLEGKGTPAAGSSRTANIGVLGSLIVASLAGCTNVIATTPVWVVAMQMQAAQTGADNDMKRLSAMQVAGRLWSESGIAGFWKGLVPSLFMVINPTIQYIMYEWLIVRLLEIRNKAAGVTGAAKKKLSTADVFVLTAIAKLGATLVTYPMLLIKSRLQAMHKNTHKDMQYRGVLDAVGRILRHEGFRGLFKGMKIKMYQTVLGAALLMAIKEHVYSATRAALLARGLAAGLPLAPAPAPAVAAPEKDE